MKQLGEGWNWREARDEFEVLAHGQVGVDGGCLGDVADPAPQLGSARREPAGPGRSR